MTGRRASCSRNSPVLSGNSAGREDRSFLCRAVNSVNRSRESGAGESQSLWSRRHFAYVPQRSERNAESCRRPESALTHPYWQERGTHRYIAWAGLPEQARGKAAHSARPGISSSHPTAHLAGAGEEFDMPAKGKHRRTKARFITTTLAAAGTGGAALALPLLSATGAHAATPAAAPEHAATSVAASAHEDAARTYTVKSGDWLAKIAGEQHVAAWLAQALRRQPRGRRQRPVAHPPRPEAHAGRQGPAHMRQLLLGRVPGRERLRREVRARREVRYRAEVRGRPGQSVRRQGRLRRREARREQRLRLHAPGPGRHRRHRLPHRGQHVVQRLPHRHRLRGPDRHQRQGHSQRHRRLHAAGAARTATRSS